MQIKRWGVKVGKIVAWVVMCGREGEDKKRRTQVEGKRAGGEM